jgi:hypothetical protein
MISAFGVDHGDISKGLPSALRNGEKAKSAYGRAKQLKWGGGRATAIGLKAMQGDTRKSKIAGFGAVVAGNERSLGVKNVTRGM